METKVIERKDAKNWLGRPVWYQSLEKVNEFGWAFIHPDTVRQALGFCKLIPADPARKDFYSWDRVRLYNRPHFRGICAQCVHWRRDQLVRCAIMEQGREPECTFTKRYKDFEPTPFWKDRGYTAKTYIRQLTEAGCEIRKKEK